MKVKYEEYDTISEDIKKKIEKISSPSLKTKLIELNTITNILLYDKEDKFHYEYKQIRGNYEIKSFNIYNKISNIIQGKLNPDDLLNEEDYNKYNINKKIEKSEINFDYKEIKDFWLIALKNSEYFIITKYEEKILHFLKDIKIELHENKIDLTLSYIFETNDYFKNNIIKKHYFYNSSNEKLERSEFDEILWNQNETKNILKEEEKNKKNFFDMFNKNKISKELDENEAKFFKNDFLPDILEYYMDLIGHKAKKKGIEDDILGTFKNGKINIKTIK